MGTTVKLRVRHPVLQARRAYWALLLPFLDLLLVPFESQPFRESFETVWPVLKWNKRWTARRLFELSRRGPGSGAIVEIGSYEGNFTIYLARGSLARGTDPVHAVDPHSEESLAQVPERLGVSNRFRHNLDRFGVQDRVVYHQKSSVDAAASWQGGSVRLLYIDGLHTWEAVMADYTAWQRFLASDHVVVFDDYVWAEVHRAVIDLRRREQPVWFAVRGGQAIFATRPLPVTLAGLP